ncbi:flagellar biosynthesis anti-sigma factor FlgM [Iocasia frigidifontis]|uniref:Negative regulator of flagellin synthesis n=1 Tax=Iocasia fonsfrigidae TaxID=2682810 RepID=A0A8A7KLP7_9FIRM|nr:flagellar biosynthesis anti-sigma factor FlgM [Iocasia fonsfrigidae]QTL98762.1 flagellar biosynthesis anti-sigma factor FlgM [Iocasia fonsfrigidae]
MDCHHLKSEDKNIRDLEEIKEYKNRLKEMSNIRWDRVEEIKKAINNGKYHIDSRQIARKMLEVLD